MCYCYPALASPRLPRAARAALASAGIAEAGVAIRGTALCFALVMATSLTIAAVAAALQHLLDLPQAAVAWPAVAVAAVATIATLELWKARRGGHMLQHARLYRAIARLAIRARLAASDRALASVLDAHSTRAHTRRAAAVRIAADRASASALEKASSAHARIAVAPRAHKSSLRAAGGPGGRDG